MKTLVGFLTSVVVMTIAYLIIALLNINISPAQDFFVGWLSCMGYYISTEIYDCKNRDAR